MFSSQCQHIFPNDWQRSSVDMWGRKTWKQSDKKECSTVRLYTKIPPIACRSHPKYRCSPFPTRHLAGQRGRRSLGVWQHVRERWGQREPVLAEIGKRVWESDYERHAHQRRIHGSNKIDREYCGICVMLLMKIAENSNTTQLTRVSSLWEGT